MKKFKVLLISILTIVLSLFCLTSCGEEGRWEVTHYKVGDMYVEVDSDSYIEMRNDKTLFIDIEIGLVHIYKEGTWAKGEEDGEYVVTFNGSAEEMTINDNVMYYHIYKLEKVK